jgi:hypothetical protein
VQINWHLAQKMLYYGVFEAATNLIFLNMSKKLQFVLIVAFLFTWFSPAIAQQQRLKVVDKNSIQPLEGPAQIHPNIEEKKLVKGHLEPSKLPQTTTPRQVAQPLKTVSERSANNSEPAEHRKIKEEYESGNTDVVPADDKTAIYPELKVTATKEALYENAMVLKEKSSAQLVRVQATTQTSAVPHSNQENENSISPLKRKYLEGIVRELEKEIQVNAGNSGAEIQSKKKELEDLKLLLAH